MILALVQTGDPVLRQVAHELTPAEIVSPAIQELIVSMFETMRAAPGVGLAAPQIGVPLQIAVIEDRMELPERERYPVAPHVIINPKLTLETDPSIEFFEGCLSLPGFTARVGRARVVRVDCLNEKAEPVNIRAEGWYARILQHEIDHLHGTLYIDRMQTRTFMTRESYEAHNIPFRQAIRSYIEREARPVEKLGHQPRLYALTQQVGAGRQYDDDVVYAAVWLHDLGVFEGHRPTTPEALAAWDNVGYAARQAPGILLRFGFPEEKIDAVVEGIRQHQPSAEPSSIEAEIVRDADILEQLGAIGVLRATCKVGRDTRFPTFTNVIELLRKALDTLPGQLRLETAQKLAQPKIAALKLFLDAVESEGTPNLY
jgi:uncharacterized protein